MAQRIRLVCLLLFVDAILLVAAYACVQAGGWGLLLGADFAVIAALGTAYIAVGQSPRRRRLVRLNASDASGASDGPGSGGGIGLPNSRVLTGLLLGLTAAFVVFVAAVGLGWLSTGDQPGATGPVILLGITVLGAAPLLVGLVRGRYHLGGLKVTTSGVRYASYLREHFVAWDDITLISADADGRIDLFADVEPVVTGPSPLMGELPLDPDDATTDRLRIPTGLLRTNTAAVLGLLEHYRSHPRDRHELRDGSALERLGGGSFGAGSAYPRQR